MYWTDNEVYSSDKIKLDDFWSLWLLHSDWYYGLPTDKLGGNEYKVIIAKKRNNQGKAIENEMVLRQRSGITILRKQHWGNEPRAIWRQVCQAKGMPNDKVQDGARD